MLLRTIVFLLLVSPLAQAEVKLTDKEILGAWQIDFESSSLDGSNPRKMDSTWTFRDDGTIESVILDSDANARASTMRVNVTYTLEDGKIVKQTMPGRAKFETCTAVEKTEQKMTLQCNNVYLFMSKK